MQRSAPREAQGCPALTVPDARQGGANPMGRERGPEPERLGGEGMKTGGELDLIQEKTWSK